MLKMLFPPMMAMPKAGPVRISIFDKNRIISISPCKGNYITLSVSQPVTKNKVDYILPR